MCFMVRKMSLSPREATINVFVCFCLFDKCSCGNSYIGQTQRNLKFRQDEHHPLKSNHQITHVDKHLYTYLGHFIDFKNPEILASAFNYSKLLIKETLLIKEQQPEINVDNFTTPLYLFNT